MNQTPQATERVVNTEIKLRDPRGLKAWCFLGTHTALRKDCESVLIGCISVLVCNECREERGI